MKHQHNACINIYIYIYWCAKHCRRPLKEIVDWALSPTRRQLHWCAIRSMGERSYASDTGQHPVLTAGATPSHIQTFRIATDQILPSWQVVGGRWHGWQYVKVLVEGFSFKSLGLWRICRYVGISVYRQSDMSIYRYIGRFWVVEMAIFWCRWQQQNVAKV